LKLFLGNRLSLEVPNKILIHLLEALHVLIAILLDKLNLEEFGCLVRLLGCYDLFLEGHLAEGCVVSLNRVSIIIFGLSERQQLPLVEVPASFLAHVHTIVFHVSMKNRSLMI